MADRPDHILPYGLAALGLGLGTLVITFYSLGETDVSYARAQMTAWLAMALATFAILWYAAGTIEEPSSRAVWRGFWTAGFLAYALHFFWAVYRTYDGEYGAIIEHQGTLIAYANFIATAIWALDVIAVWLPRKMTESRPIIKWLHFVVWLWVTVTFAVSAFRTGPIQYVGYVFDGLVILTLALRLRAFIQNAGANQNGGRDPPKTAGAIPA